MRGTEIREARERKSEEGEKKCVCERQREKRGKKTMDYKKFTKNEYK